MTSLTKENVIKLLAMIQSAYPNFNPIDQELAVETWLLGLGEESDRDIGIAFKTYLKTDSTGFAPTIGRLIELSRKISTPTLISEQEAWSLVRKALENGIYNSQREFDSLPELVQKAVGSANQIHVWASDPDYDEGVISSNFMRSYRTICQRQEEYNRMPKEARLRIDELTKQALGQKGVGLIENRGIQSERS